MTLARPLVAGWLVKRGRSARLTARLLFKVSLSLVEPPTLQLNQEHVFIARMGLCRNAGVQRSANNWRSCCDLPEQRLPGGQGRRQLVRVYSFCGSTALLC